LVDNKWYNFDDQLTKEINLDIESSDSYLLMYKKYEKNDIKDYQGMYNLSDNNIVLDNSNIINDSVNINEGILDTSSINDCLINQNDINLDENINRMTHAFEDINLNKDIETHSNTDMKDIDENK
jgi:hypothetical protein